MLGLLGKGLGREGEGLDLTGAGGDVADLGIHLRVRREGGRGVGGERGLGHVVGVALCGKKFDGRSSRMPYRRFRVLLNAWC